MVRFVALLYFLAAFSCNCTVLSISAFADAYSNYSAVVGDAFTNEILFNEDGDRKILPASLVKLMTLYVVLHKIGTGEVGLYDAVNVSLQASKNPKSKIYLKAGEKVPLIALLLGLSTISANDAAYAIAEHVGGDVCTFVREMNDFARDDIGVMNTKFANPHGLNSMYCVGSKMLETGDFASSDPSILLDRHMRYHYSTAMDLFKIMVSIMSRFPEFRNLLSRHYFVHRGKVYPASNLLGRYFRDADIGKTGYTFPSGYNLVSSAVINGRRLIGVVSGMVEAKQRDWYMVELLNYTGFKHVSTGYDSMFSLVNGSGIDMHSASYRYQGIDLNLHRCSFAGFISYGVSRLLNFYTEGLVFDDSYLHNVFSGVSSWFDAISHPILPSTFGKYDIGVRLDYDGNVYHASSVK